MDVVRLEQQDDEDILNSMNKSTPKSAQWKATKFGIKLFGSW